MFSYRTGSTGEYGIDIAGVHRCACPSSRILPCLPIPESPRWAIAFSAVVALRHFLVSPIPALLNRCWEKSSSPLNTTPVASIRIHFRAGIPVIQYTFKVPAVVDLLNRRVNPFNVRCRDACYTGRVYLHCSGFFGRDGHRAAEENIKGALCLP